MKSLFKYYVYPIAVLCGNIIGVGIFSLPFITLKVGFWAMLGYFLVLGVLVVLIHLFFSELSLKTPDRKRLPGFARLYLGTWGEIIALISVIFGIFGALLAYLIVGGELLTSFLSPIFGGGDIIWTLVYFLLGVILIFLGMKVVSRIEFWATLLFFLLLILVFIKANPVLDIGNLFIGNLKAGIVNLFLPYGVVLFSLWGVFLIPEIEEMLGEKKYLLNKIVISAILISVAVYIFFIYLVLGITGKGTTELALTGLGGVLNKELFAVLLFSGALITFRSFIIMGLTLRNIFCYDLKVSRNFSWLIVCLVPLVLFLMGVKQFIPIISFVGGITLGIGGILILLMYLKIKPGQLLVYPLFLVLLGGIIYEIIYFLK